MEDWVMNKVLMVSLISAAVFTSTFVNAQTTVVEKFSFPLVNWLSKNINDDIKIENGTSAAIVVQINVDKNSANIIIKNCGETSQIKAGSTAICLTNDAKNLVSFSSDNSTHPAFGNYQIK